MSPVRIAILAGALFAAVVAALLVRGIASGHERKPAMVVAAAPVRPTVRVLVAAHDLQVGDRLTAQDMSWQEWPADAVNVAFITDGAAVAAPTTGTDKAIKVATNLGRTVIGSGSAVMAPFIGGTVRQPMLKNEPIAPLKVVRAGDAGVLAVSLDAGMRAMSVPLSAESAAGGFILPGDHVDVVQSKQVEAPGVAGGKTFVSATVLHNVRVLAIDQNTHAAAKASVVGATATLGVTPNQAELLVLAKSQGTLTLVLRSYADIDGPATVGDIEHSAQARTPVIRVYRAGLPAAEVAVVR